MLHGRTFEQAQNDVFVRAAFERFLEVISEASRHIPDEWKLEFGGHVPWGQVAGLGNILRHVYERANFTALWSIYQNDLRPLGTAVDAMLAAYDPDGEFVP